MHRYDMWAHPWLRRCSELPSLVKCYPARRRKLPSDTQATDHLTTLQKCVLSHVYVFVCYDSRQVVLCRADTLIHHGQIRLQTLFSGLRPAGKSSCCRDSAVIHLQSFCCDRFCPQQAAATHVAAHDIPVLSETAKARWEFPHQLVVCANFDVIVKYK